MGPTHVDVVTGYELWRSDSEGTVTVKTLDHLNKLDRRTIVRAGDNLQITPQERRLNQEKVKDPRHDPFLNGLLVPLRLVEGDPDTEMLRANPNIVADEDIDTLLAGPVDDLKGRLGRITNPRTVERFQTRAVQLDATLSKAQAVTDRLAALARAEGAVEDTDEPGADDQPRRRDRDRIGFDPAAARRL